ncbi:hypothetical protein CPBF367_37890 [Xanthomonas arboricola pv. juglandis]|nr:hypothetical protein CPBF367_37890 [Xanthomonas arboricola pv. juglandis]
MAMVPTRLPVRRHERKAGIFAFTQAARDGVPGRAR